MAIWNDAPDAAPADEDYGGQTQLMIDYLSSVYPGAAMSIARNGELVNHIEIDGITDAEMATRMTDLQTRFPNLFGLR
jgi:hypothetical protein